MSRDSQAGKESRTQRNIDNPRSGRRQGETSLSLSEKAAHNDQEEVIQIPENKVGHVIGRKGKKKRDIMERSGVQALDIKDCQVRITGTEEQRTKAKAIINEIIRGEDKPDEGAWKKLDFIPEKYMGTVIGKNRENLNKIEQKTGATLIVHGWNGLYVKRSPESQKRAIREIKEQVSILIRRSQAGQQFPVRRVHVDTTQLDLSHKFELFVVKPPNDYNADETKYYQLKQREHSPQDVEDKQDGFTGIDKLRDELLMVLKNIHKEKQEKLKVVAWCHLGHAYIKEVSEVMSSDLQTGKDSRTQRSPDNPRSGRSEGDKAAHNDQEEVIQIPENKVGIVIGKKGWRRNDIKERSGVQALVIKNCQARITGTEEQRTKAKTLIYRILSGQGSPDQESWKKLDFIPKEYMGYVIGKGRENLDKIQQKTGATLKVWEWNSLCIKASPESQKRAIREIKEQVNILIRRSQAGQQQSVRLVHVDTTQLELNHKFELSVVQPPNDHNADETAKYYQLKRLEHSPQDAKDEQDGFTGIDKLRHELLTVLKNIHKEKEEEPLKVVIWCHLGHAYIKEVGEADEEEDYFTLAEIKEKLEEEGSWKTSIFEGGLDDIEIERIEKHLESHAVKEDIRYDFSFYTPSCRDVRVKAWLTENDASQDEDETNSMAFSRNAPVRVKNILTRALPDGQGDSSNSPCFYMCSYYQRKMRVDILMANKTFDYRLLIRTCRSYVAKTLEAEEEDKILEKYLLGMKIEGDRLVLPPVSARPDGFELFYQRRSLRKTYQCEIDGEQFSLIVCKEQANAVDSVEAEVRDVHAAATKTDIHLHCEEWDRALAEGNNWDPEQIVDKLPSFLQFLREVEINVTGGQ